MINVICLKWGKKYDSEYVNRLYRMVKRNLHIPFEFHCCSDDFTNISSEVQRIPLPTDDYMLETFWWKLWIHSNEFPIKGKCIFLDLDTVVQNDISTIARFDCGDDLYVLKAQWRIEKVTKFGATHQTMINSSVMVWDSSARNDTFFEKFMSNPELYMLKYHGNDDYLEYEHPSQYKTLPIDWVYCRVWGYDDTDPRRERRAPDRYIDIWNIRLQLYRMPERMICMFNGIGDHHGIDHRIYDGFEHYWAD